MYLAIDADNTGFVKGDCFARFGRVFTKVKGFCFGEGKDIVKYLVIIGELDGGADQNRQNVGVKLLIPLVKYWICGWQPEGRIGYILCNVHHRSDVVLPPGRHCTARCVITIALQRRALLLLH